MKNLCFTTLLIFTVYIATAQDSTALKKNTFDFGIRHGWSNWTTANGFDSTNDFQLYAGVFVETDISKRFSLRLETNYSRASLLEVPLLLKYKISDKFELYGGAELTYSFSNYDRHIIEDKKFGGSLIIGAQYNINSHWFIDARYIHGFTDQFAIPNGYDSQYSFGKRRSINFGVGYKF